MPPHLRAGRTLRVLPEPDDPDMHSDESMPSLQSVSDSEDGFFSDQDDDDDDDDENSDQRRNADDVPRLISTTTPSPHRPRGPYAAVPTRQRYREAEEHAYLDTDNGYEGVNENVRPTPGGFGAGLLRAIAGMDVLPPYPPTDPVLRSILGAMDSPHFVYEFLRHAPSARPDKDPQRAATIIAALERVPNELIGRYEKLRAGNGQDDFDGCPICRETLLDHTSPTTEEATTVLLTELPFCEVLDPAIIAFPCPGKHVFHAACLSPWLERKTTCPSCRFDVDPHSLTLRIDEPPTRPSSRSRGHARQRNNTRRKWEAPQVTPFTQWLEEEENKVLNPPLSAPTPTSSCPAPPIVEDQPPPLTEAGPSAPAMSTTRRNPHPLVHIVDDEDDVWTTDEEGDTVGDDNQRVADYWTEAAAMAAMRRYLASQASPSVAATRTRRATHDDVSGDPGDPDYAAERRRYLRSLMDPSNPLQLFLGDDDMEIPTLIPNRAADPAYQADDDVEDDEDLPPIVPGSVTPVRSPSPRPIFDDGYDDEEDDEEDDDDFPPLVDEPATEIPSYRAYRQYAAPWSMTFGMVAEMVRAQAEEGAEDP